METLEKEQVSTEEVNTQNEEEIKKYSQKQMNDIVSSAKLNLAKKYEKTHISLEEYNELQNKYHELKIELKSGDIKKVFVQSGGIESSFNDFMSLHKELYDLDGKSLMKSFNEIKQSKPYFFTRIPNNDEQIIMKSIDKDNNDIFKNGFVHYTGNKK